MPYPKKGEKKADYVERFMGSSEANKDYPNAKQRYAVANSMYNKRNKK